MELNKVSDIDALVQDNLFDPFGLKAVFEMIVDTDNYNYIVYTMRKHLNNVFHVERALDVPLRNTLYDMAKSFRVKDYLAMFTLDRFQTTAKMTEQEYTHIVNYCESPSETMMFFVYHKQLNRLRQYTDAMSKVIDHADLVRIHGLAVALVDSDNTSLQIADFLAKKAVH